MEQKVENPRKLQLPNAEDKEKMERRFLPACGEIFRVEMPILTKINMVKWFIDKGFWSILFIVCGVITYQLCAAIVTNYLQYPTTSLLTVMYNNTFQFPKSTFCLPHFAFRFDQNYNNEQLNSTYYGDVTNSYFARKELTKTVFLNATEPWPNEVLAVSMYYLYIFVYAESSILLDGSGNTTYYFSPQWRDLQFINAVHNKTWEAVLQFEQHLFALDISFNEARQAVASVLSTLMGLDLTFVGQTVTRKIDSKRLQPAYYDFWWLCYDLDFSEAGLNITLRSSTEYFEISLSADADLPWDSMYSQRPMIAVDLKNRFRLPIDGYTQDTANNVLQGVFGTTRTYAISTTAVYQAMPLKNNQVQCYDNGTTIELCQWECRSELIQQLCGCNSVTLPSSALIPKKGANCSLAAFTACHLKYNANFNDPCIRSCLQSCERWKYNYQLIENSGYEWPLWYQIAPVTGDQYNKWAIIRLTVMDFDYPIFTEQYVWTFQNFAGSFGGALSLLLGIDVIVVVHSVFYVFTVFYNIGAAIVRMRKTKTEIVRLDNQRNIVVVPK